MLKPWVWYYPFTCPSKKDTVIIFEILQIAIFPNGQQKGISNTAHGWEWSVELTMAWVPLLLSPHQTIIFPCIFFFLLLNGCFLNPGRLFRAIMEHVPSNTHGLFPHTSCDVLVCGVGCPWQGLLYTSVPLFANTQEMLGKSTSVMPGKMVNVQHQIFSTICQCSAEFLKCCQTISAAV